MCVRSFPASSQSHVVDVLSTRVSDLSAFAKSLIHRLHVEGAWSDSQKRRATALLAAVADPSEAADTNGFEGGGDGDGDGDGDGSVWDSFDGGPRGAMGDFIRHMYTDMPSGHKFDVPASESVSSSARAAATPVTTAAPRPPPAASVAPQPTAASVAPAAVVATAAAPPASSAVSAGAAVAAAAVMPPPGIAVGSGASPPAPPAAPSSVAAAPAVVGDGGRADAAATVQSVAARAVPSATGAVSRVEDAAPAVDGPDAVSRAPAARDAMKRGRSGLKPNHVVSVTAVCLDSKRLDDVNAVYAMFTVDGCHNPPCKTKAVTSYPGERLIAWEEGDDAVHVLQCDATGTQCCRRCSPPPPPRLLSLTLLCASHLRMASFALFTVSALPCPRASDTSLRHAAAVVRSAAVASVSQRRAVVVPSVGRPRQPRRRLLRLLPPLARRVPRRRRRGHVARREAFVSGV